MTTSTLTTSTLTTSTLTTSTLTTSTSTPSTGSKLPAAASVWLYLRAEPGCWTVGYFDPAGRWQPESDHSDPEDAVRWVHWLNGGNHDAACVAAWNRVEPELDRLEATADRLEAAADRLSSAATRWKLQARRRARRLCELQRRTARL